jgi:hypothetical protein
VAVAVIALENNDRILTQSKPIHRADQLAYSLVLRGEKRRIKIAGVGEVFVMLKPFGVALIWVVRGINTQNLLH